MLTPAFAAFGDPVAGKCVCRALLQQRTEYRHCLVPFARRNEKVPELPADGFGARIAAHLLANGIEVYDPAAAIEDDQHCADNLTQLFER